MNDMQQRFHALGEVAGARWPGSELVTTRDEVDVTKRRMYVEHQGAVVADSGSCDGSEAALTALERAVAAVEPDTAEMTERAAHSDGHAHPPMWTKTSLAKHVRVPHSVRPGGILMLGSTESVKTLMTWTLDELRKYHDDVLHGAAE